MAMHHAGQGMVIIQAGAGFTSQRLRHHSSTFVRPGKGAHTDDVWMCRPGFAALSRTASSMTTLNSPAGTGALDARHGDAGWTGKVMELEPHSHMPANRVSERAFLRHQATGGLHVPRRLPMRMDSIHALKQSALGL